MAKKLFLMLGPPGSGKTYLAQQLATDLHAVHLNPDVLRYRIFPEPTFSPEESGIVYGALDVAAERILQGGFSVIYDANCNRREMRKAKMDLAAQYGADYRLLFINTSQELAIERITTRGDEENPNPLFPRLDASVYHKLRDAMELPMRDEPTIFISGTALYDESLRFIQQRDKDFANSLGEVEL